jgi:transcriptional regulator with XRE-family HTH domain
MPQNPSDPFVLYRQRMANGLKARRLLMGLTLHQMAERCACSHVQVHRLENPECLAINPRLTDLARIAAAYDVDLGYILSDPWREADGRPPEPLPSSDPRSALVSP